MKTRNPKRAVRPRVLSPATVRRIAELIRAERPDVTFAMVVVDWGPGQAAPVSTVLPLPKT